ncbi:MAG: AarF/ABC1/UbiB kinase family protein [Candidatus Zixiibacteriota bacterium]|nr:MAG: AarF/ABC1/UbiB kinase family protein [candidate division Zixibacteria bacterium]
MPIPRPDLTIKNIKRYRAIAGVFIKYGFGEIIDRLNLRAAFRLGKKVLRRKPSPELSFPERIRLALEELGPTFVKLGQVLSMRPFLIPYELVVELTKLHDQVAPMKPEIARKAIEENLECRIDEAFKSLDPEPVASASLSQVHNAVLHDGTRVVVKIQRPGIKEIINSDMIILKDLASLLEKHIPESRQYEPLGVVSELEKSTNKEVNFLYEARNIEIFARNFKDDDRIFIPRVFWEYTTRRMLTMERIEGIKITDTEKLRDSGIDPIKICEAGGEIVFQMVFDHGFFHADPHPGNLFVTRDGKIAPVDYGMMGVLSNSQLNELGDILTSVVSNDAESLVYSFSRAGALPETINKQSLEADIGEMLVRYHKIPLSRIDMSTLFDEFFDIIHRHEVSVKSEFMIFGKAVVTYEEVARKLNPDYDLIKSAIPFVKRLMLRKMSFSQLKRDLRVSATEWRDLVTKVPMEIREFTSKLNRGKGKIGLDVIGLARLISELDKASNRLSFALVIAAIIVGSSLVLTIDIGLKVYGVPVLGLIGYLFAGILGAGLAISILRSGKL